MILVINQKVLLTYFYQVKKFIVKKVVVPTDFSTNSRVGSVKQVEHQK